MKHLYTERVAMDRLVAEMMTLALASGTAPSIFSTYGPLIPNPAVPQNPPSQSLPNQQAQTAHYMHRLEMELAESEAVKKMVLDFDVVEISSDVRLFVVITSDGKTLPRGA